MKIDDILDEMDELLDKARPMPLAAHKAVIDIERLRELIDDARLNVPQEIKQANLVTYDKTRILNEARQEAEKIVQQAEERAKAALSEQAILRDAKREAAEMISKAKTMKTQIEAATTRYVDGLLTDAEKYFEISLKDIHKTKAQLVDRRRSNPNEQK